jgi:hypothetical protein
MNLRAPIALPLVATIALAAPAFAGAPAPTPVAPAPAPAAPEAPAPVVDHFPLQILGADLAALTLGTTLAAATGEPAFLLSFLLAAPTVHAAHGDAAGAVISGVLHIGGPLLGAYTGYAIDAASCGAGEWFCGLGGFLVGAGVGTLLATGIDAGFLSYYPRTARRRASALPIPTVALAPHGGLMLGLAGRL